ncbi:josephin-2-like isoform X1 [Periplaneta americana]|uniref:josephin-2-like isoform X1 n=1 Tax=Periplaneta americana TaxID=6978 RepID=UPI0037E73EA8
MQTSVCWRTAACLEHCWGRGDNRIGVAMNGAIYHERQVKELCALHALNNLFQERDAFSKTELDAICYSLSPNVWINPHKSLLGLGNYDINVIMAALQRKGHEAIWFDKRKDPKCLNLDNILGFILNVPSDYKLGFVLLPLRRRHWVTIRQIHGTYYNLDSKLESPQLIGRSGDVTTYLCEQLECKEKELFVVVTSEVEQNQSWQYGSHGDKNLIGNNIDCFAEESVGNHHSHIHLEATRELLPNFSTCSSTRITPNVDNKAALASNIEGSPADGNMDSVTQHMMCNISNKRTINSPLLDLNR